MRIGVPKEIKTGERRCALTPSGAKALIAAGHQVGVQTGAGVGAGFADADYKLAGARIVPGAGEVYGSHELIVKVKEPLEEEYELIRPGQLVFGYFHFASSRTLTHAMKKAGAYCFSFEMVRLPDRSLPLLTPMSEVAGRLAVLEAVRFMQPLYGGKGKLVTGLPGVLPANILIIGAGVAGINAARVAAGLGAEVTLADIMPDKLRMAEQMFGSAVKTLFSGSGEFDQCVARADAVIGAALVPGQKAPIVLSDAQMQSLEAGTVLADIAIDQGGCFPGAVPTSLTDPVYIKDGLVRYAVPNMPGAVPRSSALALANAVFPYLLLLANAGAEQAVLSYPALKPALEVARGEILNPDLKQLYDV